MTLRSSPLILALIAAGSFSVAQSPFGDLAKPHEKTTQSVSFLFPEQVTVTAGKPSSVDLHFQVAPGLHVNSHTPAEAGLIATTLKFPEDSAIKLAKADYPHGQPFNYPNDPSQKLSVYTGEFTIHAQFIAPKGDHLLQASLRYQACSNELCLPPRTIPIAIDFIAK